MQNTDYGLGRIPVADERDAAYPLRAALPPKGTPRPDVKYWYSSGVSNQGQKPQCVAYSGRRYLMDGPTVNKNPPQSEQLIYDEAQKRDGIPGVGYPGTNDRGLMKYLVELGYIAEYRWAQTMDDILDTLAFVGPLLIGSNWHRGMFTPGANGFLVPEGPNDGGHEYELIGVSFLLGAVRMKNTWGKGWGENGRAWIAFDVIRELVFNEGGDACLPLERRV